MMISSFESLNELLYGVTSPYKDVVDARAARLENAAETPPISDGFETRILNGDNGESSVKELGIGIGATFGTGGLVVLAVDTIADGNFESIGYGSLAIGLFGAAVALRELRQDLLSREK